VPDVAVDRPAELTENRAEAAVGRALVGNDVPVVASQNKLEHRPAERTENRAEGPFAQAPVAADPPVAAQQKETEERPTEQATSSADATVHVIDVATSQKNTEDRSAERAAGPAKATAVEDPVAADAPVTAGAATTATSAASSGCPVLTRTLSLGSRGDDVTALQRYLVRLGLLNSAPSGFFGNLTQKAVWEWQSANNISALGVVGPKTRAALTQYCASH
jgi:hypothetical protein